MNRSYFVKMRASSGLLLGGVKETRSSRFESRRDAVFWAQCVLDGNRDAGRDVDPDYDIVGSNQLPEIPMQRS
jgi:hypothetical protein